MEQSITEIERKILDFMVHYLRSNTYQPSIREIGERFGIKSTKTVSEHLQALADKGFLERDPSRSRGVKILGVDLSAQTVSVPCYHELPQGRGGLRIEQAEMHLTLDRRLAGSKGSFFVRAKGQELASLDISEGDYLLVEPAAVGELVEGSIVVARVDGGPSFYRFSKNGKGVFLTSPEGDGSPKAIEDPEKLHLIGRVVALYRRLDGASILVSATAH
ncbi:MAG: repressor LexA [Gemmatimonadetes bacterium]|nr:repressor LexA [Gemmatimonadota bacterium]